MRFQSPRHVATIADGKSCGCAQVLSDVCIRAGHRELDTSDFRLVPPVEERLPATRGPSRQKPRLEGAKIQRRKLHVELGEPSRVVEAAGGYARPNRLCDVEVQPVEPLQTIAIDAGGLDGLYRLKHICDRLKRRANGRD